MAKESYTIYELAAAWEVHWSTIWRMIHRGQLAAFRVGRSWRVGAAEKARVEQSRSIRFAVSSSR